jgi:hypothetical protein
MVSVLSANLKKCLKHNDILVETNNDNEQEDLLEKLCVAVAPVNTVHSSITRIIQ